MAGDDLFPAHPRAGEEPGDDVLGERRHHGAVAPPVVLVPRTIVTNSLRQARAFAIEHGPVVYKPLRITPFRGVDGNAVTLWVVQQRRRLPMTWALADLLEMTE